MSAEKPEVGTVGWVDLTVPDAEKLRDFYTAVVGWKAQGLDMGRYEDFVMSTPSGKGAESWLVAHRGNHQAAGGCAGGRPRRWPLLGV